MGHSRGVDPERVHSAATPRSDVRLPGETWPDCAARLAGQLAAAEHDRGQAAKAGADSMLVSHALLDAFVDESDCWFDHHGGCQEHGFLEIGPGERCPQVQLKDLLAANADEVPSAGRVPT